MTPNFETIADYAVKVTAAEAKHAKAAAAEEARNAIAARLADLAEKRQAIVLRRAEGRLEDSDPQELAVLGADLDGLEMLLGQRDAAVAEARVPERAAAAAVAAARLELGRAEARATEEALTARIEAAAAVMVEGLKQARKVRDQLGGGMLPFRVSDELWAALTPLRHNRPW